MAKPTTIRVPEDLINEIDRLVKEKHLDRSAYLREVLRKGFRLDKQERLLSDYSAGKLSLMDACHKLDLDPWEILPILKATNTSLSVKIEDWLDSADFD
jgi:metal-responsive CopG/Arc/MetJ family transcriptional regulator